MCHNVMNNGGNREKKMTIEAEFYKKAKRKRAYKERKRKTTKGKTGLVKALHPRNLVEKSKCKEK